ncbi:hypothetical protein [Pseudomonas sp. SDO55104_S430]
MTTRRQFMFIAPAAMVMLSGCSFTSDTCEERQRRSIKRIVKYVDEKISPLDQVSLDEKMIDVASVVSGLSSIIGDQEIKSDSDAAAVIVKAIKKDSESKNYVVLGGMTVTRTEGFIYLIKSPQGFSLKDDRLTVLNGCPTKELK